MKIKLPAKDEVEIDMAPMIDMVFLLLIFFMVASVVTELDKKEVTIPTAEYGKVPDDTKGRLMLSVDKDGKIYAGLEEMNIEQLKERITVELELNPNVKILVRADENVQYKTNKEIMLACAEMGAVDIIYATFEE
jgi:biopolymer transport protein ExbD